MLLEGASCCAGIVALCANEGLSPEWVSMCLLRLTDCVEEYLHCLQLKGMNQVIGQIILFSGRKLIMGNLDVLGQYFFQLVNLFDEMLSRPTWSAATAQLFWSCHPQGLK